MHALTRSHNPRGKLSPSHTLDGEGEGWGGTQRESERASERAREIERERGRRQGEIIPDTAVCTEVEAPANWDADDDDGEGDIVEFGEARLLFSCNLGSRDRVCVGRLGVG